MTHTDLQQDSRTVLWFTALHVIVWTLLMLGFWFNLKPAMIIGFFGDRKHCRGFHACHKKPDLRVNPVALRVQNND